MLSWTSLRMRHRLQMKIATIVLPKSLSKEIDPQHLHTFYEPQMRQICLGHGRPSLGAGLRESK